MAHFASKIAPFTNFLEGSIPDGLENLQELTDLELHANHLSGIYFIIFYIINLKFFFKDKFIRSLKLSLYGYYIFYIYFLSVPLNLY